MIGAPIPEVICDQAQMQKPTFHPSNITSSLHGVCSPFGTGEIHLVQVAPKGVDQIHSRSQLHNYFTIESKRGYGVCRNPLVFLVGHVGFEPTTS